MKKILLVIFTLTILTILVFTFAQETNSTSIVSSLKNINAKLFGSLSEGGANESSSSGNNEVFEELNFNGSVIDYGSNMCFYEISNSSSFVKKAVLNSRNWSCAGQRGIDTYCVKKDDIVTQVYKHKESNIFYYKGDKDCTSIKSVNSTVVDEIESVGYVKFGNKKWSKGGEAKFKFYSGSELSCGLKSGHNNILVCDDKEFVGNKGFVDYLFSINYIVNNSLEYSVNFEVDESAFDSLILKSIIKINSKS